MIYSHIFLHLMAKTTLKVEGMMCEKCVARVESALGAVEGVKSVKADYKKGTAVVESDVKLDDETLVMAVLDEGFKAKIKRGLF